MHLYNWMVHVISSIYMHLVMYMQAKVLPFYS